MGRRKVINTEPCQIHDHFDGWGNCVECQGECKLHGADRIATELARWMCERAAMLGWRELPMMEASTLQKAGIDPKRWMQRAIETTPPRR